MSSAWTRPPWPPSISRTATGLPSLVTISSSVAGGPATASCSASSAGSSTSAARWAVTVRRMGASSSSRIVGGGSYRGPVSNIAAEPAVQVCHGRPGAGPVRELLPARAVPLGESTVVRRLLPTIGRRMVGAWCFVDHGGPDEIAREPGMQVPPHPHTGLQTVSWLLDGEVHHGDSLGSDDGAARGARRGRYTPR